MKGGPEMDDKDRLVELERRKAEMKRAIELQVFLMRETLRLMDAVQRPPTKNGRREKR